MLRLHGIALRDITEQSERPEPMEASSCPDCRSHALRRRKRSGFGLYFVSLFGQWPYRCEECGSNFLLRKRYLRPSRDSAQGESGSGRRSSRPELTAPMQGVAAGDAEKARGRLATEAERSRSAQARDAGEIDLEPIREENPIVDGSYSGGSMDLTGE